MKHTLFVLFFSIVIYTILILICNFIFSDTNDVIINRIISGVIGVISVSAVLLVAKKKNIKH